MRQCQRDQARHRKSHADDHRIGHRLFVGIMADHRLEHRAAHLENKGQHADLREIELIIGFDNRINRRQQGLDGVVDQMSDAQRDQDRVYRFVLGHRIGACCSAPLVKAHTKAWPHLFAKRINTVPVHGSVALCSYVTACATVLSALAAL